MATPKFLVQGRQVSSPQSGSGSVASGIGDPRDPASGGRGGSIMRGSSMPGAYGQLRSGVSDIMRGRLSLLMLDTLILAMVGFYVWTHKSQGGG